MASGPAVLTAQSIADSLGIPLTKPTLLNSVAQEGEQTIQRIIGAAALLSANSFSQRLSTRHINRILLAEYLPPVLGYDNSPTFSMISIYSDPNDLFFSLETPIPLTPIALSSIPPPVSQSFQCQYLLTEGVPSDKKLLSNRRLLAKPPKIERFTSQPSPAIELTQRPPISIIRQVYDTTQTFSEVVNGDLQLYFVRILNLLKDDTVYSKDLAIRSLANDIGLHQLLPYFLQFIFGQITLHFQEIQLMDTLLGVSIALVLNDSIGSELYVHAFLKIGFAIILGVGIGNSVYEDERGLRAHAAELLGVVVKKYKREYPTIHYPVFNSLVECLFGMERTLGVHYGALLGIRELGGWAVKAILPHLKAYYRGIVGEVEVDDKRQFSEVERIGGLVRKIVEEVKEGGEMDGELEIVVNELCEWFG
jgi:transcription initiation factor TFIID subunit 6